MRRQNEQEINALKAENQRTRKQLEEPQSRNEEPRRARTGEEEEDTYGKGCLVGIRSWRGSWRLNFPYAGKV